MRIESCRTPSLLLDERKMEANVSRMNGALAPHRVDLRPHVKTSKNSKILDLMTRGWSRAVTVSTLREAEEVFAAGFDDILYAVGVTAEKLPQVETLARAGARLTLILDSLEAACAVADYVRSHRHALRVLIEVDCDGHRAGVAPGDRETLHRIAGVLKADEVELGGVMCHAGGSYSAVSAESLVGHAEQERSAAVEAATILRDGGYDCPVVSVGSTPTALFARDLDGVTEVRAGVFVFFDLVMVDLGVCGVEDIALSVLTRVIGHRRAKGCIIIDAGWMALSRDTGPASSPRGYGAVCDAAGRPLSDLVVLSTSQEHGIVGASSGRAVDPGGFPIGTLLRILPNHACATAAQHDGYQVVAGGEIKETLPRFRGW